MGELDRIREDFVQLWGRLSGFWGLSAAAGRVLAWLVSRPDGADAESIMAELGMSRGAVSMACRELADWELVRAEKPAGQRRVVYRAETELEKVVRAIVSTRKRREWDPLIAHLDEWIPRLAGERSEESRIFRERLEEIRTVVGAADGMAESFLKGGVIEKLGLKALLARARRRRPR